MYYVIGDKLLLVVGYRSYLTIGQQSSNGVNHGVGDKLCLTVYACSTAHTKSMLT